MLSLYLGFDYDAVLNIDDYYNDIRKREWYDDKVVRQIIKDIDNSEVIDSNVVVNSLVGGLPTSAISGGAKACILLYKGCDLLIDLSVCGENCQEWIAKISKMVDCKATLSGHHLWFKDMDFDFFVENNNERITTTDAWFRALDTFVNSSHRNLPDGYELAW